MMFGDLMFWIGFASGWAFTLITLAYFWMFLRLSAGKSRPAAIYITAWGKRVTTMQLKDNFAQPLSLEVDDKFNNPTSSPLDAPPAWAVTDETLASVAASDDGLTAVLTPTGKLGDFEVQVSAAAGGKPLAGSLPVTIIPGDADHIAIIAGDPVATALKKK